MDALEWIDGAASELNLLPFGLEEALLPGETKQVHLYEARFLQLFEEAEAKYNGCVGQLLVTPGGNVAAVSSLLEVEESRRQEVGVWARLRCVARIRLLDVDQTDYGYARARCALVTDDAAEADEVAAARDECLSTHAACRQLETKLRRRREGGPADTKSAEGGEDAEGSEPSRGGDAEEEEQRRILESLLNSLGGGEDGGGAADERVEWGHEVRSQGPVSFGVGLTTLADARRETLCFRGLDAPPVGGLDGTVQRLWGAPSELAAETMLLSFTAAACLSVRERTMALAETSTLERLQASTAAFREAGRRLAAELALADATAPSGDAGQDAGADGA